MLISRYQYNPVLTKDDVPYEVATVHNAAVVKHQGKYMMVFRAHKLNGRSILGIAESEDGFNFEVKNKPFMTPSDEGMNGFYSPKRFMRLQVMSTMWFLPAARFLKTMGALRSIGEEPTR
jgi:predicted GH43/DUF377 family glycosyl hydrolase